MAAPKLYPATINGRWNSCSSQSRAASTSPASASPSCAPWLRPMPRKLKRSTGQPRPQCGIVEGLHGVVHNLVVEIAAEQGMGMADERGKRRIGRAFSSKPPPTGRRGPLKRDAANRSCCEAAELACVSAWSGTVVEFMPLPILRSMGRVPAWRSAAVVRWRCQSLYPQSPMRWSAGKSSRTAGRAPLRYSGSIMNDRSRTCSA